MELSRSVGFLLSTVWIITCSYGSIWRADAMDSRLSGYQKMAESDAEQISPTPMMLLCSSGYGWWNNRIPTGLVGGSAPGAGTFSQGRQAIWLKRSHFHSQSGTSNIAGQGLKKEWWTQIHRSFRVIFPAHAQINIRILTRLFLSCTYIGGKASDGHRYFQNKDQLFTVWALLYSML